MRLVKATVFTLLALAGAILAVLYAAKVLWVVQVYGWPDPSGSEANAQVGLPVMLMAGAGTLAAWAFARTLVLCEPYLNTIRARRTGLPAQKAGLGAATSSARKTRQALVEALATETYPSSDKVTVLIVDDIPATLTKLERLLSLEKNVVVVGTAKNGKDGVEQAKRLKPDIVLMDIIMPIMDGIQATESITRMVPQSQIIAMSVIGDFRGAVQAGAREFLIKPFTGDALVESIRRVDGQRTAGKLTSDPLTTMNAPPAPGARNSQPGGTRPLHEEEKWESYAQWYDKRHPKVGRRWLIDGQVVQRVGSRWSINGRVLCWIHNPPPGPGSKDGPCECEMGALERRHWDEEPRETVEPGPGDWIIDDSSPVTSAE